MPKPVQGFLTSDGRFYPTAWEARFHEAESKLLKILYDTYDESAAHDMLSFMIANREEILEFLNARQSISAEGAEVSQQVSEPTVESDGSFDPELELNNRVPDAPKPKRLKPRPVQ